MHLLIIAIGSAGDVYPFVSIGRAAVARGHRVTVCTSPAFRSVVEGGGLAFRAVGTAEDYARAMADPALWQPRTSLRVLWRTVANTLEPLYDLLCAEADADTVMLGSLWAFSARVLQETRGTPYLAAQVSPSTLLSAHAPPEHARLTLPGWWPLWLRRAALRMAETLVIDPLMKPALDRLRRSKGLAPASRVMTRWMHSPDGVLALFPAWFAPAQPDWPSSLSFVGFPLLSQPAASLDEPLRRFLDAGSPPVVLTVGSTPMDANFFGRAVDALTACGVRVVVIAPGAVRLPADGSMVVRTHLPLPPLLARSMAIWHHGGIGTTAFALRAGLPQMVTPLAHDQFDNARRIVSLGVGVRARPSDSASSLAQQLRRLLASAAIAEACREVGRQASRDSGAAACERAVDLVEVCHHRRRRLAAETPGQRTTRVQRDGGAAADGTPTHAAQTAAINA